MKKKALRKDFRMEVKKSLNRFLSIFFIVAMGVAFYSGIQSSAPDMRATGDAYFDDSSLMDIRVIGTLGLTEDDLDEIRAVDGVAEAEGCYSEDVYCGEGEIKQVLHIESLPEQMNKLTPAEGSLPSKADECFLDASYALKMGYKAGDTLEIDVSSEEDSLLRYRKFTVSGIGYSPCYISFERGSTTLGTGSLSGFVYVLPEAFDSEIYTVAYVKVEGAQEAVAYTPSYDDLVETVYDRIEAMEDVRCEIRYDDVMQEAQGKLDDARQEVEDGRKEVADAKQELADGESEAESELSGAESELTEGETELADGKAELADAKKEVADGEQELADGEQEIAGNAAKLADARKQIADARDTLNTGESEYQSGLKKYKKEESSSKKKLSAAQKQIDSGRTQIADGWKTYNSNLAQIEAGEVQLEAAEQKLADGKAQYDAAYPSAIAALDAGKAQYDAGMQELKSGKAQYKEGADAFAEKQSQYDAARAQVDGEWTKYNADAAKLSEAQKQYDQAVQLVGRKQKEYDDAAAQTADLEVRYTSVKQQTEQLPGEIAALQGEVEEQKADKESAQASLESWSKKRSELESQKLSCESGKQATDARYQELQELIAEKTEKGEDTAAQEQEAAQKLAESEKFQNEINVLLPQIQEAQEKEAESSKTISDCDREISARSTQIQNKQTELAIAVQALPGARKEYEASAQTLAQKETSLSEAKKTLTQRESELNDVKTSVGDLEKQKKLLNQKESFLTFLKTELTKASATLAAEKGKLDAAEKQLAATKTQLDEGYTELAETGKELTAAAQEIAKKKQELAAGRKELKAAEKALKISESELESSQEQVNDGYRKLTEAKSKLKSAHKELNLGWAQLKASQSQLSSGESQLSDARTQLSDARSKLADARAQILDGEAEIAENEQKLADGWKDYEEGKLEAQQKIEDGKQKIADAEQELSDAEQKIADAQEELDDLKVPKWYVDDRNVLPENTGFGENADRLSNIAKVFPVLFFLVAALISLTTMTRMVEEERTQIGTLKALGYSKGAIAAKYMKYAFLATVGGSIFGVLFGEKIFPWIIINAYGIMYQHLPEIVIPYNVQYGIFAAGAAFLCTMGATLFACIRELLEVPASLMRPPSPKEGKRVLLEYIPFIWRPLSFTWKSTVRNLMRYKKRFLMTIIGIGGCMGLLLVGYGLRDSIMDVGVRQFEQLQLYDAMVVLDSDASAKKQKEAIDAASSEQQISAQKRFYMQREELKTEDGSGKEWSVYVYVPENLEDLDQFLCLRDRRTGETYELTDEGAVITEKVAKELGIEPGDTVALKQEEGETVEIPISAVCENYLSHYIYLTPALYERVYGKAPEYNSIFFTSDADENEIAEIGRRLLREDAVLNVMYTGDMAEQIDHMLGALDIVIVVLIISAGMLAFVVLYNLNNININERKRELATIKVLGFYDGEVAAYVYRENILLTVIGAALGILIGKVLHAYIITTVEVDACMFGRNINLPSFIYGTLFTFGFSIIVNVVMYFKLKKINMVESLKSVE